ncbi:unnamed protein product [Brachionus calyciflorus]|uniref:Uncharacterized protein n=1 Tax=Brachionus calyciflorus TaxID=104777 RepID=A0A813Q153_9BILA|nr:unnamed protein product [Brachionus calyciflorus]
MCDFIEIRRVPRRSVSCVPVIRFREKIEPVKQVLLIEEKKPKVQIVIDIDARSRPSPPKPKCILVKEMKPCCPQTILVPFRCKRKSTLGRGVSQPNLTQSLQVAQQKQELQPTASQQAQWAQHRAILAQQQTQQSHLTPSLIAKHQAFLAQQQAQQQNAQPTESMIARHHQALAQQQEAQPTESMIARHRQALVHQQAFLQQQQQALQN